MKNNHSPRFQKSKPENAELIRLQKIAIASLDYSKAEELEQQIQSKNNQRQIDAINQIREDLFSYFDSTIENMKATFQNINQHRDQRILGLRRNISARFNETRNSQIQELIQLQAELSTLKMREIQRKSPDYEELIAKSRTAAECHNFALAKELQNMANEINSIDLEKRLKKLEDDYKTKSARVIDVQKTEILKLSKALKDGISKISGESDVQTDREKSIFEIRLSGAIRNAIKDIALVAPGKATNEYLKEFEAKLSNLLEENSFEVPQSLFKTISTTLRQSPAKNSGRNSRMSNLNDSFSPKNSSSRNLRNLTSKNASPKRSGSYQNL
ncbi:hypothetical protein GPJ56_006858 [Histomonas meleagridis]|uniref:uncharacterized protein n=1 Tax=Histomonas meleagridis TaxID=135588 RepID=UPI003559B683|nr:hypothetical protein GPJ56_006858 [Histomonas meleagridis]KAH0802348.1 hypothetical protein GO595_004961 [Histomonas meleagridis]